MQFIAHSVRVAHGDMALDDRFDEPMRVQVKSGLETACWAYVPGAGHRIFIGDGVLEKALPSLSADRLREYVALFVHHERAHAMLTERCSAKTAAMLATHAVPFPLYNLVEDARIEYAYSRAGAFSFNWSEYEAISGLPHDQGPVSLGCVVSSMFFNLIQCCGDAPFVQSLYPGVDGRAFNDALGFYTAATLAKNSAGAIAVAADILAKYPDANPKGSRCSLELGASLQGPDGLALLEQFERDAIDTKPARGSGVQPGAGGSVGFAGAQLLSDGAQRHLNHTVISQLATHLHKLSVRKRPLRGTSDSPAARVSVRHALRGQARWISPEPEKLPARVRTLFVAIDVSGSMEGSPLDAASYLVAALSEAARRGLVRGDVVLSTTGDTTDGCLWQHKPLPWTIEEAQRIESHSAEGLEATLRQHEALVMRADAVLVITDGNIAGARIPHARYRRLGKTVIGAYVNDHHADMEEVAEGMGQHFSRVLIRNSVQSLVAALVLEPL